ncbi:MAG: Fur family transcriptional regulator, ferric uptake regulator [Actinomycetota bacterium]|jgi:Fur family ferric uptake transcriptional regulator|nr:Fur family transcriptional regulator, ferric uptake regulator [Actinomycetota bacterium]
MQDLGERLRASGMRLTRQRERIIAAVRELGHATPDGLAATVAADGGPALSLSTIYRNLEALEEVGVVSHTHLDHRSPTYHLSDHADHIHLVCLSCGSVIESAVATADLFVGNLLTRHGFVADVKHMAIHGWCPACSAPTASPTTPGAT